MLNHILNFLNCKQALWIHYLLNICLSSARTLLKIQNLTENLNILPFKNWYNLTLFEKRQNEFCSGSAGKWYGQIRESESECEVAQSRLTVCDPMDCSLPGSSIHGIFQARIVEWVTTSFSRRSSQQSLNEFPFLNYQEWLD